MMGLIWIVATLAVLHPAVSSNSGFRSDILDVKGLIKDVEPDKPSYKEISENIRTDDFKDEVLFFLYTSNNKDNYQQLKINDEDSVKSSNFDPNLPTTFITHGYMDNIYAEVISIIKNNILEKRSENVFGVDWSSFSMTINYNQAVDYTKSVGSYLGSFIEFMTTQGLDVNNTHLIGHSLGAHVSGFAGAHLGLNVLSRITGLDPAKPGFENAGSSDRLDASDAQFVDCIHTCAGDLGMGRPYCYADFYPNGGDNVQPGCPWFDFIGTCSHSRSYQYYAESIQPGHLFRCLKCAEVPVDGPNDRCVPSDNLMGEPANPKLSGYFYVRTNSEYPFANDTISH